MSFRNKRDVEPCLGQAQHSYNFYFVLCFHRCNIALYPRSSVFSFRAQFSTSFEHDKIPGPTPLFGTMSFDI